MEIILIAAVASNGVIGNRDDLPWDIPNDLKRFKRLTLNHPVIMGRRTYDSILARSKKPLPDRTNIVLTRNENFHPDGIITANSIDEAILLAATFNSRAYVIGGETVYRDSMERAFGLEITEVTGNYDGDSFFPRIDQTVWKEVFRENHDGYSFVRYRH
jgi:dihydrofolate reductase